LLNCHPEEDTYKFALVGATSSLFHDLIMTPTEVIKQRLQLIRSQSIKIKSNELVRHMYRDEGLGSFYRSFSINYFMNVPFGSIIVLMN
jgi:solute carrier family 25 iron transporter 28/37